jgi:Tfp pilus assembly pilus retraction ATPase PilT
LWRLFKRIDKKGRVAALEILIFNTAVANLVREGKTHQIPGMIQVGKKYGNTPLDDCRRSIRQVHRQKEISPIPDPSTGRRRDVTMGSAKTLAR